MRSNFSCRRGFTLVELLVVIAIIGILAALLLAGINGAYRHAKRVSCISNVKQINTGVHLYADDHRGWLPVIPNSGPPAVWSDYTLFVRSYLGIKNRPSPKDALFQCPADTFYYEEGPSFPERVSEGVHLQSKFRFTSYSFNAANSFTMYSAATGKITSPGIAGMNANSIKEPLRTASVFEFPALGPYSWHQRVEGERVNNSRNIMSFVDGHVGFIKIYWDATNRGFAHAYSWNYDPPLGYDYKWSGN